MSETKANFSQRNRNLGFSPIRDILAVLEQPGIVSFAEMPAFCRDLSGITPGYSAVCLSAVRTVGGRWQAA